MRYIIAIASVCPMRADAGHKSEMVSQLLLGEAGEVLEEKNEFAKIRCQYDGYEGWCANSQIVIIDDIASVKPYTYTATRGATALLNGTGIPLSMGTPVFGRATAGNYIIEFEEQLITQVPLDEGRAIFIKQLTYRYLNTPYLWGGKSSVGIDCSGFTQQVYKILGIQLLRDAYQQATQGDTVNSLEQAVCGDLAFFNNEQGRITHVGILLDNETIIHASGYVRIDKVDNEGIIHSVTGQRTHKLCEIKRVL